MSSSDTGADKVTKLPWGLSGGALSQVHGEADRDVWGQHDEVLDGEQVLGRCGALGVDGLDGGGDTALVGVGEGVAQDEGGNVDQGVGADGREVLGDDGDDEVPDVGEGEGGGADPVVQVHDLVLSSWWRHTVCNE